MLESMGGAVLGFAAPWAGEALKLVRIGINGFQEYKLRKLELEHAGEAAEREQEWRYSLEEMRAAIRSQADARKPVESWSIKLLDKSHAAKGKLTKFCLWVAFMAFMVLDWLYRFMRPGIVYAVMGVWLGTVVVEMYLAYQVATGLAPVPQEWFAIVQAFGGTVPDQPPPDGVSRMAGLRAMVNVWGADEMQVTWSVVGYLFGERTRQRHVLGR